MRVTGHLRAVARRRPHVADLAIAGVVLLVTLLTTSGAPLHDGVSLLLAGVACGSLAARRRWPYAVLLVSTAAAEGYLARHHGSTSTLIIGAPLVALYTLAELSDRRRSLVIGGALVLSVGTFHTLGRPARLLGPENIALVALGALAVAAGEASRHRRAYLTEVVLRAADAERDREAEARRRVTEERLRIARDLHDSVGHHLALINVQAGVARHVMADQPAQIRQTFDQIRLDSRAALEELRESVGLLRQPGDAAVPVEPTVGLTDLDRLLATFEGSGLRVVPRWDGARRAVGRATDVTAYRVIQESLTNVRKHTGAVRADLVLRYEPQTLSIIVQNDGPAIIVQNDGPAIIVQNDGPAIIVQNDGPAAAGCDPPPDAHGIVGMRERVTALGGTLLAGPRPGGGFRVSAVLPLCGPG
jgi:signal transduction histidine kinase